MAAAATSWLWRGEVRDMNPDHQEMRGSEGSLRLRLMDEGSRKTFAWHPLSPPTASVHHLSLLHLRLISEDAAALQGTFPDHPQATVRRVFP